MLNPQPLRTDSMQEEKTFKIPSRSYGITASEAADMLLISEEIKKNKTLRKEALSVLKSRKKAIEAINK